MWVNFFDTTFHSLFKKFLIFLKLKNYQRADEIKEEIHDKLYLMSKSSGFYDRITLNKNSFFLGDFITLADYALFPLIHNFEIIFKTLTGKSILESNNNKFENSLLFWKTYIDNLKKFECFTSVNLNLKVLPDIEKNTVMKMLKINSIENYDYENLLGTYYSTRILSVPPPKI